MRKFLMLLAFFLLPAVVSAQSQNVTSVVETLQSTGTVMGVSVSSAPATSVVVSTTPGYRFIGIQNLETATNLFCSDRSNTSTTSGATVGMKIFPGQVMYFSLAPYSDFFCVNDSGSGAVWAAVFRGR